MPEATLWFRRAGKSLTPISEEGDRFLSSIPDNAMVMVNMRTPRNPHQHRLIWHLARLIYENSERFDSPEHVMEQIKIGTGQTTRTLLSIPGVGDVWQIRGLSIAFESMPQQEFAQWLDRVLDYVSAELLPGVSREDVVAHIQELMAPPPDKRRGRYVRT